MALLILNNLNNSTIASGASTNNIVSIIFPRGNTGILNICLSDGINNITNINAADTAIASINLLLLNIPVLNIDFLLFLILNT